MKKIIGSILTALTLLLGSALPSHAWGGHHHGYSGHHGFGGHYGGSPYRYGYRPFGYGYSYPRSSYSGSATPQQPTAPVQERFYWYYCESARAYHPYVQQCPEGWMKVVPPATGPGQ